MACLEGVLNLVFGQFEAVECISDSVFVRVGDGQTSQTFYRRQDGQSACMAPSEHIAVSFCTYSCFRLSVFDQLSNYLRWDDSLPFPSTCVVQHSVQISDWLEAIFSQLVVYLLLVSTQKINPTRVSITNISFWKPQVLLRAREIYRIVISLDPLNRKSVREKHHSHGCSGSGGRSSTVHLMKLLRCCYSRSRSALPPRLFLLGTRCAWAFLSTHARFSFGFGEISRDLRCRGLCCNRSWFTFWLRCWLLSLASLGDDERAWLAHKRVIIHVLGAIA